MGFVLFWHENGYIDFTHFCLESGMVFKETTGMHYCIYNFNSKWIRKKEKCANLQWILRNLFCFCSNLSNDSRIS